MRRSSPSSRDEKSLNFRLQKGNRRVSIPSGSERAFCCFSILRPFRLFCPSVCGSHLREYPFPGILPGFLFHSLFLFSRPVRLFFSPLPSSAGFHSDLSPCSPPCSFSAIFTPRHFLFNKAKQQAILPESLLSLLNNIRSPG